MRDPAFETVLSACVTESAIADTVSYLCVNLKKVIAKGEAVLICFPNNGSNSLGGILERAITACDGVPVFWSGDYRWNTLLKTAFLSRATTIIGAPMILLGLAKLAAHEHVPLNIYNAVLTGYPCFDWAMDGIKKGLDCNLWGMLCPGMKAVIAGFSCECGPGIHLRDDIFRLKFYDQPEIEDPDRQDILAICHNEHPEASFPLNARGRIRRGGCKCGSNALKLMDIEAEIYNEASPIAIVEKMQFWSSILDCRVEKTEFGLVMEIIYFDGEKLPKIPSCAKLVLRKYDPEKDIPLDLPGNGHF